MHYFLGAATVAALAVAADARPLTFNEAVSRASAEAPSVAGRDLDINAARTSLRAAAALPDPRVEVGVEGFPVSGPNAFAPNQDDFAAVRVWIIQDIPNAAKRRARAGLAGTDVKSATAAQRAEMRRTQVAVALAWVDLYFAQERLKAIDRIAEALAPQLATTKARVTSGSLRPAETLAPERASAQLDDRRASERATAGRATAELVRWTGDPAPTATGPAPALVVDAGALRAGLDELPDVAVAEAMAGRAAAEASLAEAERRPDWGVQASYARRDPRFGDMLGLGVVVSLPLWKRQRQDPLAAGKALTAQAAAMDAEAARRAATAALSGDLADHAMHRELLRTATDRLVPLAEREAALERASYAAGRATLGEALAAQLAMAEARLEKLNREAAVTRDAVRLNLIYGSDR